MTQPDPALSEVPREKIGRYRLVQRVGEGAFAEVFFARDEETLAPVALKVLRDDIDPSIREQVRVRFLAEERITKAIEHPFIVNIRETSPAEARPCFLAMDFVAGRPFGAHLARLRAGRLGTKPSRVDYLAEVARLGHQVASAMAAAHARGIVHRDLKPQNVLVGCEHADGLAEVRIVDFGIAKAPVELFSVAAASSVTRYWTELGTVMGSPPCMAPEQCGAAQLATGKADVFALGVMLFGSLFDVDLEQLEARSVQLKLPEDLENSLELRGPLPPAWEQLLRGMLSRSPESRPEMKEVAQRLQQLARTDRAFADAVDGWLRARRVPSARQLLRFSRMAERLPYLTEDEQRFLKQAPLQKLQSLKRGLVVSLSMVGLGGVTGGVALVLGYHDAGRTDPAGRAISLAAAVTQAPSAADTASNAKAELERVAELSRELSGQRKLAEESRRATAKLREELERATGSLGRCQGERNQLKSTREELQQQLDKQNAALERCDGESERLLACRQETADKSRELLETTRRLQMCTKSLRESSLDPVHDILELGFKAE